MKHYSFGHLREEAKSSFKYEAIMLLVSTDALLPSRPTIYPHSKNEKYLELESKIGVRDVLCCESLEDFILGRLVMLSFYDS